MKFLSLCIKSNTICARNLSYAKMRTWYANLVKPRAVDPPYRHVIQIGDPRLRSVADPVPLDFIKSQEILTVFKRMYKVFKAYNCVGLSAPQIGAHYRIFMMEFNEKHAKQISPEEFKSKEMTLVPFTVVVNPELRILDFTKVAHTEACESVKGFCADVPRYKSVELTGLDDEANSIKIEANGWTARIIQHEIDHLNGKMFTDAMDKKTLSCTCWEVINERSGRVQLPYSPHV